MEKNRTKEHWKKFVDAFDGRLKRTLDLLDANSEEQILGLTKEDVTRLPLCGEKSWLQIKKLQETIKIAENDDHDNSTDRHWINGSPKDTAEFAFLTDLPLFSSKQASREISGKLHDSGIANVPIEEIPLPTRAATIFRKEGIATLGQLLLTNPSSLMEMKNFGTVTLKEVREKLLEELRGPTEPEPKLVWSSFEALVDSFARHFTDDERELEIVLGRIGLGRENIPAYRELSLKFGITRERVRQIWTPIWDRMSSPRGRKRLQPLRDAVETSLSKRGGVCVLPDLWEEIKAVFGWDDPLQTNTLKSILTLWPLLEIRRESLLVCLHGFPCLTCESGLKRLKQIISEEPEEVSIEKAVKAMSRACAQKCEADIAPTAKPSPHLLQLYAETTGIIAIEDGKVFAHDKWRLARGKMLKDVVKAALESVGRPIHYSKLVQIIREENERYADILERNVHNCLVTHDDFKLAGRGTYGLSHWNIRPYLTHAQAIIDLLIRRGGPMKRREIIKTLTRKNAFKENNLRAALYSHPRLVRISSEDYDLREKCYQH